MHRRVGPLRITVTLVALAALVAVIAWPVLAADPSGSPSIAPSASASTDPNPTTAPTPTTEPTSTADATLTLEPTSEPAATAAPTTTDDGDGGIQMPEQPPKPDKPDRAHKAKGDPVTVSGTVGSRADEDGRTEYTLTSGSTVLVLDAGPSWFYGEDHPLAPEVGTRVTIVGTQRAGESEVEVETVDGVPVREPGKPPWAGGWKVVGEAHPGWSAEKAERWAEKRAEQAKRHGASCWPPGQCKDAAPADPTLSNPPGD